MERQASRTCAELQLVYGLVSAGLSFLCFVEKQELHS